MHEIPLLDDEAAGDFKIVFLALRPPLGLLRWLLGELLVLASFEIRPLTIMQAARNDWIWIGGEKKKGLQLSAIGHANNMYVCL